MRLRHNYLLISLNCLTVLLIVNLNCVSSSSLPVNKLVNEALKRQQREALAEAASESTTELSEDSESDLGPSGSVNKVTTIKPTNLSSTNSTNHNKIDWDEIESTWYEFKDDEEVTKKWNDMENGLKKGNFLLIINIITLLSLTDHQTGLIFVLFIALFRCESRSQVNFPSNRFNVIRYQSFG